jgi:hypothetical protein
MPEPGKHNGGGIWIGVDKWWWLVPSNTVHRPVRYDNPRNRPPNTLPHPFLRCTSPLPEPFAIDFSLGLSHEPSPPHMRVFFGSSRPIPPPRASIGFVGIEAIPSGFGVDAPEKSARSRFFPPTYPIDRPGDFTRIRPSTYPCLPLGVYFSSG